MNYWEYRKLIAKLIPRMTVLSGDGLGHKMKEKGRKSNYQQYNIKTQQTDRLERLLDKENINSFVEVSLRAQSCPMPLNIDVWDGLKCPYQCKYCYADYFRHSLYTSFFDNTKSMGLRHCDITKYKAELDKLFTERGKPVENDNEVVNAIRLGIPMRLGIRFEDFPPIEEKKHISLELLRFLAQASYPVMINTKSALPAKDEYLKALTDNPAKSAIHITMISSDESILKKIEPGAPSFAERIRAAKALARAGVRMVARIEPWMMYINDEKDKVDEYIAALKDAGVKHITFDSYSYSANSRGLATNFMKLGIDFDRMFLLSADSQWLSSFMLGKFMEYFRDTGFDCSTFDQGNVPANDDTICCSVGDWFDTGFNYGCGVVAIRFIAGRAAQGLSTTWKDFCEFVDSKGGWLSSKLKKEVQDIWNGQGDAAWPIYWGEGMKAVGNNEDGIVWTCEDKHSFRKKLLEDVLNENQ